MKKKFNYVINWIKEKIKTITNSYSIIITILLVLIAFSSGFSTGSYLTYKNYVNYRLRSIDIIINPEICDSVYDIENVSLNKLHWINKF
jgi:hypothetical protein